MGPAPLFKKDAAMPLAKHPEVIKLHETISRPAGPELADKIAYGRTLPLGATLEEKSVWVGFVCGALEEALPEADIIRIRMGCHCDENGKLDEQKRWLREIYLSSSGLEDFVGKMNELGAGWWIEGNEIYTTYHDCSCPMLAGLERLESKTWCYCTVGYGHTTFEYVFDGPVKAKLVESIKLGSERCVIKISRAV